MFLQTALSHSNLFFLTGENKGNIERLVIYDAFSTVYSDYLINK